MARLSLPGARMKTAEALTEQHDARLTEALRDLDEQRKRAQAAEQDVADLAESLADATRDAVVLQGDLISANQEIDRLKAIMLPPPMDGRPIELTTDPVQALIGEALDMEIGGEK